MWSRKNGLERGIERAEHNTAIAVDQLAERIRERLDNETGQQLADTLTRLAERVEALDLADQVKRGRKELRRAAKQASKQVERSRRQLAAAGAHAVPAEPSAWIAPTLLGFLFGFGLGLLLARFLRPRRQESDASQA